MKNHTLYKFCTTKNGQTLENSCFMLAGTEKSTKFCFSNFFFKTQFPQC